MMPTVDPMSFYLVDPRPPDVDRVPVQLFHVVLRRPQAKGRTLHSSACHSVFEVMLPIDCQPRPIVVHHPMHDPRVVDDLKQILICLGTHQLRLQLAIPR